MLGKPRQPIRPLVALAQLGLCASLLGNVMKNEHHPDQVAGAVLDRRRTVLDGHFPTILGDKCGIVGQTNHAFFTQNPRHRVFSRRPGLLIDDPEDVPDRLAHGLLKLPAGQRRGNRIEKSDPTFYVAGDDGIADTAKRYAQPLALPTSIFFRPPAPGDLRLQYLAILRQGPLCGLLPRLKFFHLKERFLFCLEINLGFSFHITAPHIALRFFPYTPISLNFTKIIQNFQLKKIR